MYFIPDCILDYIFWPLIRGLITTLVRVSLSHYILPLTAYGAMHLCSEELDQLLDRTDLYVRVTEPGDSPSTDLAEAVRRLIFECKFKLDYHKGKYKWNQWPFKSAEFTQDVDLGIKHIKNVLIVLRNSIQDFKRVINRAPNRAGPCPGARSAALPLQALEQPIQQCIPASDRAPNRVGPNPRAQSTILPL